MLRHGILLLGLVTPAFGQTQVQAPPAPVPQITVVGTSSRDVEPDRATLSVGVTTENTKPSEAASQNARTARTIVDTISTAGIEPRDIRSSAITLEPIYTQGSATVPPVLRTFRAGNQVSVTIRKIEMTGALIGKLSDKGVTNISGPSFEVTNAALIVDELRAEAAKDARRKAEMIANGLGIKLGRVLDVRSTDAPEPMYKRAMAMRAPAPAPPVEAGTQALNASVTVAFEIAP